MNLVSIAYGMGLASMSARLGGVLFAAIITASLVIWVQWLRQSGPKALEESRPRRNCIPLYLPFLLLLVWLWLSVATATLIRQVSGVSQIAAGLGATAIVQPFMIIGMSVMAVFLFAKGLKGIGLDARTLRGDLPGAAVNLAAVMPLVYLGIVVVDLLGGFFKPDFEIKVHEALKELTGTSDPLMRLLMVVSLTVITPIFEEILFRGFVQSKLRGYMRSAWLGILITSVMFAVVHPLHHWLAIFILSAGFGYAYERSGSLFRPIIMHVAFNTTSVVAALLSQ